MNTPTWFDVASILFSIVLILVASYMLAGLWAAALAFGAMGWLASARKSA